MNYKICTIPKLTEYPLEWVTNLANTIQTEITENGQVMIECRTLKYPSFPNFWSKIKRNNLVWYQCRKPGDVARIFISFFKGIVTTILV